MLNFVALILDEKEKEVLCAVLNYVCGKSFDLYDYYKLYRALAGDRALVVVSSTVALYMEMLYGYEIDPLDNGELLLASPRRGEITITSRRLLQSLGGQKA